MARVVKQAEERRKEIIQVAQTLFYQKGYENSSIKDIVTEMNVAKGTFYYYFESKAAVLEAVVIDLTETALLMIREIVADPTATTLEKWNKLLNNSNSWKLARKSEMLHLMRLLHQEENLPLRVKLRQKQIELFTPEYAKIIGQGIDERIFRTDHPNEMAEITLTVMNSLTDTIIDLLLNPEKYENRIEIARRKYTAVQTAVEQILGAEAGIFPLFDEMMLAAWFTNEEKGK